MERAESRRPALAFLEREEQRELEALKQELTAAGEDLCALGEIREFACRHPELAVAASAALGAALAPLFADVAGAVLPKLLRMGLASAGGGLRWPRQ